MSESTICCEIVPSWERLDGVGIADCIDSLNSLTLGVLNLGRYVVEITVNMPYAQRLMHGSMRMPTLLWRQLAFKLQCYLGLLASHLHLIGHDHSNSTKSYALLSTLLLKIQARPTLSG